jgi:elongation factor P--(R)-beta-lysine ligase
MRPRRSAATLAPSDVDRSARSLRGKTLRVGGRVVLHEGETLVLADALATLRVTSKTPPVAIAAGDLVEVEGRLERSGTLRARVVRHYPGSPPRTPSEFSRFAAAGVGARLEQRARALSVIRDYFAEQRFLEVETPFRVTAPGVDRNVDALRAEGGFLITSPEHHLKRLLVGGMPRVFELAHVSRADELGPLHEPEFSMLEWYRAFAGSADVMRDTEQIVYRVVRALTGSARLTLPGCRKVDVRPPFPRLSVRQAFRRYAAVEDAVELCARDEARFFQLLVDRVEPALAARSRPVFLCDYPASQAALARLSSADPSVAERFELYLGGVELCNGYGELTDPGEQRRRHQVERTERRRDKRRTYPLDRQLIAALEEGLPPAGGNALGVDRLVMLATGASSVADVQAFPEPFR